MDNIEATNVLLAVGDYTATTPVTTTSNEGKVAGIELDKVIDLSLLDVETNGVVDADMRIGVTDGTTVVGDDVRDTLVADSDLANFEQLVGGLLRSDTVDGETTLDVVKETEVLARLLDRDDICMSKHEENSDEDLIRDIPMKPVG